MKRGLIAVLVLLILFSNVALVSSQEPTSPTGLTNGDEITKTTPNTVANSNTQTEIAKPGILTAFKNWVVNFSEGVIEKIRYVASKMFDFGTTSTFTSTSQGEAYKQLQGIGSGGW